MRFYLLCGCIVLFNIAIYESSNVACSTAGLVGGFGEAESIKKLVEDFDGLLILGLGVGCVTRY